MNDEVNVEQQDVQEAIENKVEDVATQENASMDDAYKMVAKDFGWNENGEKDAKTFMIDHGKIKTKKIKNLEETVNYLVNNYAEKDKKAYERAIQELSAQKQQAVIDQDLDKYNKLEQQYIETLDAVKKAEEEQKEINEKLTSQQTELFDNFIRKNSDWWNDVSMQQFAIGYESKVKAQNPHMDDGEILGLVEQEVRRRFPDHAAFRRDTSQKVTTSDAKVPEATDKKSVKLSRDQEMRFNSIKRAKEMIGEKFTKKDYMKLIEDKLEN